MAVITCWILTQDQLKSWLSYDFDARVPVEKIVNSAKKIRSGDILVFHDNQKSFERLKIILPQVVQMLKENGIGLTIIIERNTSKAYLPGTGPSFAVS